MYRRRKRITIGGLNNLFGGKLSEMNWGKIIFFSLIGLSLLVIVLFLWYSRGLPDPGKIQRRTGYSTQILDRTGKTVLYDVYSDQDRRFTPLSDVPQYLKDATISIEDKDFYKHKGFDPLTPLRIAKNILVNHRLVGGSTLTQQLVKTVLLTNERKISRKIREFVLAVKIEKTYSKDEILQMYLNEVPYGGGTAGVAAAAQQYFGKEVKDLNLTECVILAGLPQSPSRYSPYIGESLAYVPRAKDVVRRMREDGKVTKEQEEQVVAELDKVVFKGVGSKIKAPHFVMYVKQLLEDEYGSDILEAGGLKVTTSLNWELQDKAETIVKEEIDKVSTSLNIGNGASIILDTNTGEILSMVGSKDYFDSSIDGEVNVTTRNRQPGSSIKPLVYAVGFMEGYSPASVLADMVTEFPGKDENTPYIPKNYDGKEHGLLHLREALASSINIPAVKLLARVGVSDVLAQGYKMGFTTLEPTKETLSRVGLSMALGGAEIKLIDMVSAYSTFANGGYKVEPVAILRIEDSSGKVIYENKSVKHERVLDDKVGFLINSVLSDNNARLLTFGVNSYLNMGSRAVAVKTGTTNDLRDNWTVGWSKDTIVGVWVGNNDNDKMKNVASGVSGAAPIWRREMLNVLSIKPDSPFTVPQGVSQVEVDRVSGYPAHDGFASYKEWFINGTVPSDPDPIHTKLKICKGDSNRLADQVSVSQGNYDEKEYIVIKETDPLTAKNLWQKGIDQWIVKQTDSIYKPPTETCGASTSTDIQIVSPTNHSRVNGETVSIKFTVVSSKSIVEVKLYVDGTLEQSFTEGPYVKEIKLTNGKHSIQVVAKDNESKEEQKTHEFSMNEDWE
ncbi:MAG TPA: transglycosylase domain-containing protein [Candidatus Woesebacteria bacterium]|nr:transglycosylase domain-containing protein [Candidatus Woesebacteria bacterium]